MNSIYKKSALRSCLVLALSFTFYNLFGQDLKPYNQDLPFIKTDNSKIVAPEDSIKVLLVDMINDNLDNFKTSIMNNPQIVEIQINHATSDALYIISDFHLQGLRFLFVFDYKEDSLMLPFFAGLDLLSIKSDRLSTLDIRVTDHDSLSILTLDLPMLVALHADSVYPNLSILDIRAPQLKYLPFQKLPSLFELVTRCAFESFPKCLCSSADLNLIWIMNLAPAEVPACLREAVNNGMHSELTVYHDATGDIIDQYLSKDQQQTDH